MLWRMAVIAFATFATLFFVPIYRSIGSPKPPAPAALDALARKAGADATGAKGFARGVVPASPASGSAVTDARHDTAHREWQLVADADGEACRKELSALGIKFRSLPDRAEPDRDGCGIPHGVLVTRGSRGIVYTPPLRIDCTLARELPWIEELIQKQAEAELGSPIQQITTFGTYSCRRVRGGFTGRLSEHSVGNAIDFGAFLPKRGKAISVARDYRPHEDNPAGPGLFLRGIFWGLRGHGGLSHVIGPETRADHHDHIHVDRGEPWWHFADRLFGGR
jgi:hypothetical protein